MKTIIKYIIVASVAICSTGCEVHELWDDGRPDLEHVYYLILNQPNNQTDYLSYEIAQNGDARWRFGANATSGTWQASEQWVASIPFSFRSERVRTYDVVSYFYVVSTLTAGTDYTVTREDGTVLTPGANGAYSVTWPQAIKGDQNIRIKRTQGSPNGTIRVQTFDPAKGIPVTSDVTTLVNNKTTDYEVRCSTYDINKVMVTFN